MRSNRRRFLGLLAGAASTAAAASIARHLGASERPNILYCLADDWGWPHAGAYGDKVVNTPAFDRVAGEGALFKRAYCAAPSCTPSRAAMLTGQAPHRLAEGGNLHGFLPARFPVYPDLLERAGYRVGFTRKGWGPGKYEAGGRTRNPAGPVYETFENFLAATATGRPFAFWFGSQDPHRAYEPGSGRRSGMDPQRVTVPPYLIDAPEVRSDVLDYYFEVQRFDSEVGRLLQVLEEKGLASNTLVVITGDNGWPFPRSKANLYDSGTHQPFAVRWPGRIRPGQVHEDFISLADIAPTFLEAAGLKPLPEMTGRSILELVDGREKPGSRDKVFVERERHANVRRGDLSYPSRAIRTRQFLYIRNFRPERWPAGDPEFYFAVGPFGDCDGSPSKDCILARRNTKQFALGFEKRPEEELFDLEKDPYELHNVAGEPRYAEVKTRLRSELDVWMKSTADPRASRNDDPWDHYPYFGEPARRDK